jgi:acyl-CoA thioesterase
VSGSEMSARVERLIAGDRMIALYGIEVEEASESLARVSAIVKEDFLQVHGLAHGAFIFTLIDVAFALNVNAKLDAVAVQWSISQFRSGNLGERLTAECRLLHGGRRLMVVDLVVTGAEGKVIAKGQATAIPVGEAPPTTGRC